MGSLRAVAALLAVVVVAACGSFGSSSSPPSDAGGPDASSSSSGTSSSGSTGTDGGDAGTSGTGCALFPAATLCSDFDVSTSVQQATKSNGNKLWLVDEQPPGDVSIISGSAVSAPNFLRSSGDGTAAPIAAQVSVADISIQKDIIRLAMAMRIGTKPTSGDAYFATLEFTNIRFIALIHPDGKLELAQAYPPAKDPPTKSQKPTVAVAPDTWAQVEIHVDRRGGQSQVELRLNGTGGFVSLEATPLGPARVGIGIGYCDVSCGTPSLDFDDVVLTEE